MKDLFEICGECRHLSDAEVVYQMTNSKETSKQVNAMLSNSDDVSIEDVCNLLTPARREMALAVIELYKRIKERKNNRKTMHFLRNSLSAYKNLTQQIDAKQSCQSEEMKRKIDSLIIKNNKCAKNELEKITKRADFLLEKDKNPFEIEELKPYSFIDIFTELRNVWNESFSDERIEIENIDVERCEKYKINSNFEGLDILFSDWISNMSKYKNNCVWCNVSVKENNLIIKFENDYTCTEDKITQLISDLNEDDRRLITRRTTHGIYLIKKAITELNINHKAYKAKREECGDTIVLALTLEMKKNEDYE